MSRIVVAVIVLGCVALALTNPSMSDFQTFAQDRSEELITTEIGDSSIGRALARLGSSLAGDYVDRITERKNYFLFSTYAIGDPEDERWTFLGIAGNFVETNRPSFEQDDG